MTSSDDVIKLITPLITIPISPPDNPQSTETIKAQPKKTPTKKKPKKEEEEEEEKKKKKKKKLIIKKKKEKN